MSDKTAKKPTPVVQKKDRTVLRGKAPERNDIAREMFMRSWGGGKHHNPQDYARGKGRNPKHKGQRSDRSWEGMTSPMARFEEGVSADPTVNMTPEQAAEWKKQNAIHRDQFTGGEAMRNPKARFEEGVSADPTANMSPEDAAKWNAMNESHRDQFKAAARYSKDPYWMIAKYPGKDADGKPFRKGERVFYYPLTKTILTGAKADRASAEFDAASFDEDYGFRAASGPDDEKDHMTALRRLAVAKKALQRVPVTEVRFASNSLAAAWGPVLSRTAKGLEDSCWEGYTAVGMKEMGGKQVPNCVPSKMAADLAAAWGNLMIVADDGSPEADKAELKKDADPASHDQNLASTWEKVAATGTWGRQINTLKNNFMEDVASAMKGMLEDEGFDVQRAQAFGNVAMALGKRKSDGVMANVMIQWDAKSGGATSVESVMSLGDEERESKFSVLSFSAENVASQALYKHFKGLLP